MIGGDSTYLWSSPKIWLRFLPQALKVNLHSSTEKESTQCSPRNTCMHTITKRGPPMGPHTRGSCHHGGWSNEGSQQRQRFFSHIPIEARASTCTILISLFRTVLSHCLEINVENLLFKFQYLKRSKDTFNSNVD